MLRRYLLGGIAWILLFTLYSLAPHSTTLAALISNAAPLVASFCALAVSVYVFRHYGARGIMPRSFMYFSFGLVFWFLCEITWAIYGLGFNVEIPHSSIADAFWLIGYLFVALAIVTYLRAFQSSLGLGRIILASAVAITVVLVLTVIAIGLFSNWLGFMVVAFGIEFPLLEVAALFLSTVLIAVFRGGRVRRAWYFIAAALIFNVAADLLFGYATSQGVYQFGNPVEIFYESAYILLAFGLYEHSRIL